MNRQLASPEYERVLDECLDAVFTGSSVDTCVARYPQFAEALRSDLQLALFVQRLSTPTLSETRVELLEKQLRATARKKTGNPQPQVMLLPPARQFKPLSRLAAAVLIAVLLGLLGSSGAVIAAADDLPDEALYGVKRTWENVVVGIASVVGQLDTTWLQLANTRLYETHAMYSKAALAPIHLSDLYDATYNAIAYASPRTTEDLRQYLQRARRELLAMQSPLETMALFNNILLLTAAAVDDSGVWAVPAALPLPGAGASSSPDSSPTAPAAITATLSATATEALPPTLTLTMTSVSPDTPRITPAASAAGTVTQQAPAIVTTTAPRIPPTETRTPTPTTTATGTATPVLPSATATATWTDLPAPPGLLSPVPGATETPRAETAAPRPTRLAVTPVPPVDATARQRATQQAVYLTQTAGPPQTEEPSSGE